MAQFRRTSLILLAAAACSQAPSQAGPTRAGSGLVLSIGSAPGSLRIANTAAVAVSIEPVIEVEAKTRSGWRPLVSEFNAVAVCLPRPADVSLRLPANAAIAVVPWRGYSCSGQCENVCRGNIHYGRGPFRFVVTVLPDRHRVVGPAFDM